VGFASGIDPLFLEYKTLIGPFHLSPREVISAALKERGRPLLFTEIEQISVISWALPASEDIRRVIARKKQFHLNSGPTPETWGGLQYRPQKASHNVF